jgi:tight adherence protein B
VTSWRRRLTALGFLAAGLAFGTGPAFAANDASIDHSEVSNGQLKLLVSVPGSDDVDLSSVSVTIDGAGVPASAIPAETSNEVDRTTVLAIDTSGSMHGARIAAAKTAALTYLDAVPANVNVGIVTFNGKVQVAQKPSTDRNSSKAIINSLTLGPDTALYEGISAAIAATGTADGQHQVLVLSVGEDSTGAEVAPVIAAIKAAKVKVDAVSLEGAGASEALSAMATAGGGSVFDSDAAGLEQTFSDEANVLARQILVTATVPQDQSGLDATVAVKVDAGSRRYTASAFVAVNAESAPAAHPGDTVFKDPNDKSVIDVPQYVMYGALGAIAVGVLGLIGAFATAGPSRKPASLQDQLQIYSASAETSARSRAQMRKASQAQSTSLADSARQAAAAALASNSGFEDRIAKRLEGAGMALKSSEWLLLHLGIAFVSGMFGLLLSGGNPIAFLLLLFLGAIGPWIYLGLKRSRRLKAFDSGLADTLQLMSGSLSAGLSLAQSLDTIVREGNEPITSEFKRVIVESRLGVTLEDALEGVADRMMSKDFTWVVMAIRIQREVGGNLAELLNTVAATLREREYLRRHVQALSAEGRLSCWILGGLPPAFLGYLVLAKPAYVHPMFSTGIGILMLIAMAVLLTVGIFWMSKVAKVDI